MKACSKCKIEKDDKEYYTYFHSTKNKIYTRRICNTCFKLQKVQYRKKVKELIAVENNPDYRKCNKCGVYKLKLEGFYKAGVVWFKTCKECELEKDRAERMERYLDNGGSGRFYTKPNEYIDDYQKENVFMLMKAMGWTFNEDTKVWSKPGIKDKNNKWNILKPFVKEKKPKRVVRKTPLHSLTYEAILEYRNEELTYDEIGKLYNVSGPAVRLKMSKYERQNRGGLH